LLYKIADLQAALELRLIRFCELVRNNKPSEGSSPPYFIIQEQSPLYLALLIERSVCARI
jgi:hypothetical protein